MEMCQRSNFTAHIFIKISYLPQRMQTFQEYISCEKFQSISRWLVKKISFPISNKLNEI